MNRKVRMWTTFVALIAVAGITASAWAQSGGKTKGPAEATAKDIVDTAVAAGKFGTLVTAVKAAEMVEALQGEGPLTVFAPTDEAFAKLPKGTLEALLKNPAKLRTILKYHVVSGKIFSGDVVKLTSAKTLLGQTVKIDAAKGVKVNDANVTDVDIACKNGVIHVIDTVLLPQDDIVDVATKAGSFQTLLKAVETAGLVDTLRGEGPFTVFAPNDEAFAKLPKDTLGDLLQTENRDQLTALLTYHVVPGRILLAAQSPATLEGRSVTIQSSGKLEVNGAKVLTADIAASNGVIHIIDTVLIPPDMKLTPAQAARAVIELAIERGVPLFNSGQHAACAAVYEVAVESLLKSHTDALAGKERAVLQEALNKVRAEKDNPRHQAWMLRRAMDAVYEGLADL